MEELNSCWNLLRNITIESAEYGIDSVVGKAWIKGEVIWKCIDKLECVYQLFYLVCGVKE